MGTNHIYCDWTARTPRKGAVSPQAGKTFLCPVNLRDGTFVRSGGIVDQRKSEGKSEGRKSVAVNRRHV